VKLTVELENIKTILFFNILKIRFIVKSLFNDNKGFWFRNTFQKEILLYYTYLI